MGQYCRDESKLTFTISDIEQAVLEVCPYRPTCLEAVIDNCNGQIKTKTDYETSLDWTSWSISVRDRYV